jgi:predicted amidohydrolase
MDLTLVQLNPVWEDPAATFRKVEHLLAKNPPHAGALIVLPEMFATGFSLDLKKTCTGAAVETEAFLRSLAARHQSAVIAGTVRMDGNGMGRNEALVLSPAGTQLARYLKQRPFSGAGEELAHERGSKGATFVWGGMLAAPLICYDLRFPELFRGGAKGGVEVFVVIAAWPKTRIGHWVALLRARAIENQAYVIGVNRTGDEPSYSYCGRSLVVDPHGEIVCDVGEEERVVHAKLDPKLPGSWREEFPAYTDFLRWG